MPGYEMMFRKDRKPLPWSWAVKRLTRSRNYWLITVRKKGAPHVMPVWGLWMKNVFFFSTGPRSRKARNLEDNSYCVVCTENIQEAVILEGSAETIGPSSPLVPKMLRQYQKKYKWKLDGSEGPLFTVSPHVVFGLVESGSSNPTRWTFPDR